MGQTYHFEQNDEVMATYTAPETSIYIFSFTGTDIPCFNEPEHINPTPYEFFYGSNLESCRAMPLEAGQTVYLYSSSLGTMSAGTMTLLEPPSTITLDSMSPELSTDMKLSASTDYRATFFFSTSVTATSGSIRFEDGSYTPCALSVVGSSVQIGFSDQIMTAYREGKIKDGDTVTYASSASSRHISLPCDMKTPEGSTSRSRSMASPWSWSAPSMPQTPE